MFFSIISISIGIAGLVGSVIAVWVNKNSKLDLTEQKNRFLEDRIDRMDDEIKQMKEKMEIHENKILKKFDEFQLSIHNIEINIAKIAKN